MDLPEITERLNQLTTAEISRLQDVLSTLFSGRVITPGNRGPMAAPDPKWQFLRRHEDLVDAYLRVIGWSLDLNPQLRLARLVHLEGRHRVRFRADESLLILILRQSYHEHMAGLDDERECVVKIGDIRERFAAARRTSAPVSDSQIKKMLSRLARYDLVEIPWGFTPADDAEITILPLIERVVSPDEIERFYKAYRDGYEHIFAEEGAGEDDDNEDLAPEVEPLTPAEDGHA